LKITESDHLTLNRLVGSFNSPSLPLSFSYRSSFIINMKRETRSLTSSQAHAGSWALNKDKSFSEQKL